MLSDVTLPPQASREERNSLHGTGRGGEEGREGRRTTTPGRQIACSLLPWSPELPEGRCPKAGTRCCQPAQGTADRVSCSIRWATPDTGDGVPKHPQQVGRGAEPLWPKPSRTLFARCCLSPPAWCPHSSDAPDPDGPCPPACQPHTPPDCLHPTPAFPCHATPHSSAMSLTPVPHSSILPAPCSSPCMPAAHPHTAQPCLHPQPHKPPAQPIL